MERQKLCDSFDSDGFERNGSNTSVADYVETIALLHNEVERLEQELQLRDESQRETTSPDRGTSQGDTEAASAVENGAASAFELERLQGELVSRDETIRLLLAELSRVEDAQEAARTEWEQLAAWVDEMEHRVEGQQGETRHDLANRLAAQEQKAESLEVKSERDRRDWEAQRQIYQVEIARLQSALEHASTAEILAGQTRQVSDDRGPDENTVEALRAENLRLRAAWEELVERTAAADRSESLEAKLAETLHEKHQLHHQFELIEEQSKRERLEHEVIVAELQARLSEASLTHMQAPPPENIPQEISPALEVDLKIRALRHQLVRENEERRQKSLVSRLSRLLSRAGPG
jgi:hypothetical protein